MGTGANVVHLGALGFESWGVDCSSVAIGKARVRAEEAGVECSFVEGDLTAPSIPGVEGPFDLLLDFGTLDDLKGVGRRRMAATIGRLARPGSLLLGWCFHAHLDQLPGSASRVRRALPRRSTGRAGAWFLLRRR